MNVGIIKVILKKPKYKAIVKISADQDAFSPTPKKEFWQDFAGVGQTGIFWHFMVLFIELITP